MISFLDIPRRKHLTMVGCSEYLLISDLAPSPVLKSRLLEGALVVLSPAASGLAAAAVQARLVSAASRESDLFGPERKAVQGAAFRNAVSLRHFSVGLSVGVGPARARPATQRRLRTPPRARPPVCCQGATRSQKGLAEECTVALHQCVSVAIEGMVKSMEQTVMSSQALMPGRARTEPLPSTSVQPRLRVEGKYFARGSECVRIKGVTYGPFAPN